MCLRLEPILGRIAASRKAVVVPTIDNIYSTTMTLHDGGGSAVGAFWWSLHFTWMKIQSHEARRRHSDVDPVRYYYTCGGSSSRSNPYNAEIFVYKSWRPKWVFFNFKSSQVSYLALPASFEYLYVTGLRPL